MAKPSPIHNEHVHDERTTEDISYRIKQKINALITLIYPSSNKIKFKTSKSRTSTDFIDHLRNIGNYIKKNKIKRFILITDNASFRVSRLNNSYRNNHTG